MEVIIEATGLTIDELDQLTLLELRALQEHRRRQDELQWMHTGSIISYLLQPHLKKGAKVKPIDFNPYRKSASTVLTEEEIQRDRELGLAVIPQIKALIEARKNGKKQ